MKENSTIRLSNPLRRRASLVVIALALLCGTLLAMSLLRASAGQQQQQGRGQSLARTCPAGLRENLGERVRKGSGTEVRFAAASDSADQVNASVDSVARFIHDRSGMRMSDETKRRLAKAEKDTLKGKAPRLSLDELIDSFAGIVVDRVSVMTDSEIEGAADVMTDSRSDVAKTIVQQRMSERLTRAEAKAQRRASDTPYGAGGFLHPSPLGLVFNKTAVNKMLDRAEGGDKK